MTVSGPQQASCAEHGCNRPTGPTYGAFCVFHAPTPVKPEFWPSLIRELNEEAHRLLPDYARGGFSSVESPNHRMFGEIRELTDRMEVNLKGLKLPGGAIPNWAFLYDHLSLNDAEVHGDLVVRGASRSHDLHVSGLKCFGSLYISQLNAPAIIRLENCEFRGDFTMRCSQVRAIEFVGCSFLGNATIERLEDLEFATFRAYTFFSKDFEFVDSSFRHTAAPRAVLFDTVRFHKARISFRDRHRIEDACEFRACDWRRTRGRGLGARLRTPDRIPLARQEEQFRQLRLYYARGGNAAYTNEFALSETETQRLKLSVGKWWKFWRRPLEYYALSIYKSLTCYNSSYLRPVLWIALVTFSLSLCLIFNGFTVRPIEEGVTVTEPRGVDWDFTLEIPAGLPLLRDLVDGCVMVLGAATTASGDFYTPTSTTSRAALVVARITLPSLSLLFAFAVRRRFVVPDGLK